MGKGGSLTLGFPTDFLQSSTPDVDGSAGGNASAFQEEINKLLKDTTKSKNGFRKGFKPPGPASRRKQLEKILTGTPGTLNMTIHNIDREINKKLNQNVLNGLNANR